jgi:hypothetical protein
MPDDRESDASGGEYSEPELSMRNREDDGWENDSDIGSDSTPDVTDDEMLEMYGVESD